MKNWMIYLIIILCVLVLFLAVGLVFVLQISDDAQTEIATEVVGTEPVPETTAPVQAETEPVVTEPPETTLPVVLVLTPEEEELLLKLGMAERGETGCTQCIALVMRTVLNRVEGPKFSSTIRGVIYAQDQFTPVADGTFADAEPNDACYEALDLIIRGWDESQGALYYEWCEGESWHSRNLNLLFQHCDTRFYN